MKNNILIILIMFLLSCTGSKDLMEVKQVFSDEKVSLAVDSSNIDSINIILPVEFQLKNISKKVADVRLYYMIDKVMLRQIQDFKIYNGDTGKIIYAIEDLQYNEFPSKIILKQSNYKISRQDAEILLKKYNKISVEDLPKQKETNLVPYTTLRKENPEIVKNLEKNPDSLILSIAVLKEKPQIIRKKINW